MLTVLCQIILKVTVCRLSGALRGDSRLEVRGLRRSTSAGLASYTQAMRLPVLVCLALPFILAGQTPKGGEASVQACALLSKAEVEKTTVQKNYTDPEPAFGGASCTFDNAQLYIFSGANSEARWERVIKSFGVEGAPRTPISGLGDQAYSFAPKPKNKYQDTGVFVVVKRGTYVVAMGVSAPEGKPVQSAQPHALELVKLVLGRLN